MEKENVALIKSKAFAVRIVNLYKYLRDQYKEYDMATKKRLSETTEESAK